MRFASSVSSQLSGKRLFMCLLLLVVCLTGVSGVVSAAEPQADLPDALIWVDGTHIGQFVSVTYSKIIPRATAEAHLSRLVQETGWSVSAVRINDEKAGEAGLGASTSIEFAVDQALSESGFLPIEAIVKAFRDLNHFQILYLTPPTYKFTGPTDFRNRYVQINLNAQNNAMTYDVRILDRNFTSLGIPAASQAPKAPSQSEPRSGGRGALLIAILITLIVAVLVYALASKAMRRNPRNLSGR